MARSHNKTCTHHVQNVQKKRLLKLPRVLKVWQNHRLIRSVIEYPSVTFHAIYKFAMLKLQARQNLPPVRTTTIIFPDLRTRMDETHRHMYSKLWLSERTLLTLARATRNIGKHRMPMHNRGRSGRGSLPPSAIYIKRDTQEIQL